MESDQGKDGDFEHELMRLCSLISAVAEAEERKRVLKEKLEARIHVKTESLRWSNELDEMWEKLEAKNLAPKHLSIQVKIATEDAMKPEDGLGTKIRSVLVAGTALSVARKRLEGADGASCPAQEQELESFTSISRLDNPDECKTSSQGVLTISGLQLCMLPFKKISLFTDKNEVHRTATALGYVAHVHLRCLVRLGGSHSYIMDPAPSSDSSSSTTSISNSKTVQFPLFLDSQDTTSRAAYAVFLLNKDLEQLLIFIGVRSVGPQHVLASLKELYRTITSPEYLDS